MDECQDASFINDVRLANEFKTQTFSKYKKNEVRQALMENMLKGKVEPACYWCAELVCSGHFVDIWETILLFLGKYVHLGNPKVVVYLDTRYASFRAIMENAVYAYELQLRNNVAMRKLFAEIITILTLSPRRHGVEIAKIDVDDAFAETSLQERLRAPDTSRMDTWYLPEDPREYFIALNEFAYALDGDRNGTTACWWIEWILAFDQHCKRNAMASLCRRRTFAPVHVSLQCEVIWLVWEVLLGTARQPDRPKIVARTMEALLQLFCIKFTGATPKRRRHLLYYAVAMLTETWPAHVDLVKDKHVVETVVNHIPHLYQEIKKREESPQTDYMFGDVDRDSGNLERSMRKLEMLQNVST